MTTTTTATTTAGSDQRLDPPGLVATDVHIAYDDHVVVHGVDLALAPGSITGIVGPNGCGKSTLLRGLAGLHRLRAGSVTLDGEDVASIGPRRLARRIAVLPQRSTAPEGIRVADLVARGRHPHRGWFGRPSADDDRAVAAALAATGTADLATARVDELSGGQQQRVWVAMVLAQETPIVLLDEPTTYLDVRHQVELLELLRRTNRELGTTVVAVLHELNLAARYADRLVVMRDGRVVVTGRPADVLDESTVLRTFDLPARVVADPVAGTPMVVPLGAEHLAPR